MKDTRKCLILLFMSSVAILESHLFFVDSIGLNECDRRHRKTVDEIVQIHRKRDKMDSRK